MGECHGSQHTGADDWTCEDLRGLARATISRRGSTGGAGVRKSTIEQPFGSGSEACEQANVDAGERFGIACE